MKSWKILLLAVAGISTVACSEQPRAERSSQTGTSAQALTSRIVLPWGKAPGALGLSAKVSDRPALGPQSVAVDPQGRLLVLDAQNKRVARVGLAGGGTE